MSLKVADNALDEMDYKTETGSFGQEMSVAVPAQLRFTEEPTQAIRRFHVELGRRGYSPLDSDPDRRIGDEPRGGVFYNGKICSRQHWSRMRVRINRTNLVRLYPHDEWDVKLYELADVIEAIEAGFGAPLEHYPIEQSENGEQSDGD